MAIQKQGISAEMRLIWERVRGWYHYPSLNDPKAVKKFEGGACFDFRTRETLVDTGFVRNVAKTGGITEERCLEGVFGHEIGHYMVFPRTLGVMILAGKMTEDFFSSHDDDMKTFIIQTYADMAVDISSALEEQRTGAILDTRKALRATDGSGLDGAARGLMLAYLHEVAGRKEQEDPEQAPFLEKMRQIDFLSTDVEKMRQGLWIWGNILIELEKKHPGKGGGSGGSGSGMGDCDVKKMLKDATPQEIKQALKEISWEIGKGELGKVKKWLKGQGVSLPDPKGFKTIGTSGGQLEVDKDVVEYYRDLSLQYPLVVTKKLLDTPTTIRTFSEVERWRVGTDANLALPNSSGGFLLPGITKKVKVSERQVQTVDYTVPHLLVVIDSSASMPIPWIVKSFSTLGGVCAARSYHIHGSYIGVINFSGNSFYLPYTRDLDDALGAIVAYQGGGTTVDMDIIKRMLGPEMAQLFKDKPGMDIRSVPREALKKDVELSMPAIETAFKAESLDVVMFTDGGISNLDEVLSFFDERAELNRATIVLCHGFDQALGSYKNGKIAIEPIESEKDIPNIVIGAVKRHLTAFAEGLG
ncbi:MAG: vWA domain-containing protein [Candidatus Micrarchaeota archaeon]